MGVIQHRFKMKLIAGTAAMMWLPAAFAFTPFTVKEIRAQGLQRLEIGTVLTYLPLSVGDQVNEQTSRQAMRALYGSGLFEDVALERDGDTLVIKVKERPAISGFKIDGNDKIGGDDLKKSLTEAGLAEGELFKRDLLEQVGQELQRQYFANGYYDVEINTEVKDQKAMTEKIRLAYAEGTTTDEMDGLTVDGGDWWFNVRPRNTEPVLRLNVEARDDAQMAELRDAVLSIMRSEA